MERRYEAGGRVREAPDEAVLAVLRLLGVSVDGPDDVEPALARLRERRRTPGLEPVTVAWSDAPPSLPLTDALAAAVDGRERLPFRIRTEGGETLEGDARPVDGALPLPPDLPDGVHEVEVDAAGRTHGTTLLRAPRRCWSPGGPRPPRTWGAFLPLHALRSGRGAGDLGVGDTGDLAALARWTRERGGSHVATLPLLAAFLGPDGPVEPSPYVPASRLFWNEVHLDLSRAPGLDEVPEARERLDSAGFREEAEALGGTRRADPVRTMALKRSVLEPLARRLIEVPGGDDGREAEGIRGPDAFRRWLAGRPDAPAYARFRGDPAYHLYVQWAMAEQMERVAGDPEAADLYLDLPLGVHPEGFDVHQRPELFATGARGGAPPDAMFEEGQDWGFPPLHPRRLRTDGHRHLIRVLSHSMAPAAMLRVDHVMSLHRLFWIPDGFGAEDGVYARYPAEELWAAVCLASHRNRCEVVGEDLGVVPPEVPEAMERHGALRMWVLPWEIHPAEEGRDAEGAEGADEADEPTGGGPRPDPPRPPMATEASDPPARYSPPGPGSVASLQTHDLPPFAAYWRGGDIERRLSRGGIDEVRAGADRAERARWRRGLSRLLRERGVAAESGAGGPAPEPPLYAGEALAALLRLLAGSPARLLLVDLADLWLEEERQNVPGTTGPGNWTLRAARTLEELEGDDAVKALLDELTALRDPAPPTSDPDA